MLPIVSIKCKSWNDQGTNHVYLYMQQFLENADELAIIPSSLKEIIVSDNYEEEYKQIAEKFELVSTLTNESEFVSVAKICYNKKATIPENILLLHGNIFNNQDFADMVHGMFLQILATDLLPEELKRNKAYYYNTPVAEIASIFFPSFFESLYAQIRIPIENRENKAPVISAKNTLAPFKRRVKRLHLQHQSDLNFEYCVVNYYTALNDLLNRFIDICLYKVDYSEFKEFAHLLFEFQQNLFIEFKHIFNKEAYSLDFLKETIIKISELCFFKITENPNNITVLQTPKKLFPDLIDTHDRIVAFVDILGFSNMIQHFDMQKDVILLTDLKESLDSAIAYMNANFKHSEGEIEFKLFSDCLCLSVSYFDNETDFPYQFSSIMLGVKTYQALLLQKGYLVRGGITIGSYYSDNNMIFSGALVEAVNYEKNGSTTSIKPKERPPRILVSPAILEKLTNTVIHKTLFHYYVDGLIKDSDGEVFINPIFNLAASKNVFDDAMNIFDSADETVLPLLRPIMETSVQLIKSLIPPEIDELMLNDLINKLNEKIIEFQDKEFVSKYIWTKEFTEWLKDKQTSKKFIFQKIIFKKIVNSWEYD